MTQKAHGAVGTLLPVLLLLGQSWDGAAPLFP